MEVHVHVYCMLYTFFFRTTTKISIFIAWGRVCFLYSFWVVFLLNAFRYIYRNMYNFLSLSGVYTAIYVKNTFHYLQDSYINIQCWSHNRVRIYFCISIRSWIDCYVYGCTNYISTNCRQLHDEITNLAQKCML